MRVVAFNIITCYHRLSIGDATALLWRLAIVLRAPRRSAFEPRHEISNNVVCATSKGSDQPAHTRSLIRAFASRLNIL